MDDTEQEQLEHLREMQRFLIQQIEEAVAALREADHDRFGETLGRLWGILEGSFSPWEAAMEGYNDWCCAHLPEEEGDGGQPSIVERRVPAGEALVIDPPSQHDSTAAIPPTPAPTRPAPATTMFCGFAVGLNNFGAGRATMDQLAERIRREIGGAGRLVDWHGPTGNVAVEGADAEVVAEVLRRAAGRDWAVVPAQAVAAALRELPPITEDGGFRNTPGLAFEVGGDRIVPVVKRDVLDGAVLDKHRREGGWGAISARVARERGGRWTARSWRRVDGLLRRL